MPSYMQSAAHSWSQGTSSRSHQIHGLDWEHMGVRTKEQAAHKSSQYGAFVMNKRVPSLNVKIAVDMAMRVIAMALVSCPLIKGAPDIGGMVDMVASDVLSRQNPCIVYIKETGLEYKSSSERPVQEPFHFGGGPACLVGSKPSMDLRIDLHAEVRDGLFDYCGMSMASIAFSYSYTSWLNLAEGN